MERRSSLEFFQQQHLFQAEPETLLQAVQPAAGAAVAGTGLVRRSNLARESLGPPSVSGGPARGASTGIMAALPRDSLGFGRHSLGGANGVRESLGGVAFGRDSFGLAATSADAEAWANGFMSAMADPSQPEVQSDAAHPDADAKQGRWSQGSELFVNPYSVPLSQAAAPAAPSPSQQQPLITESGHAPQHDLHASAAQLPDQQQSQQHSCGGSQPPPNAAHLHSAVAAVEDALAGQQDAAKETLPEAGSTEPVAEGELTSALHLPEAAPPSSTLQHSSLQTPSPAAIDAGAASNAAAANGTKPLADAAAAEHALQADSRPPRPTSPSTGVPVGKAAVAQSELQPEPSKMADSPAQPDGTVFRHHNGAALPLQAAPPAEAAPQLVSSLHPLPAQSASQEGQQAQLAAAPTPAASRELPQQPAGSGDTGHVVAAASLPVQPAAAADSKAAFAEQSLQTPAEANGKRSSAAAVSLADMPEDPCGQAAAEVGPGRTQPESEPDSPTASAKEESRKLEVNHSHRAAAQVAAAEDGATSSAPSQQPDDEQAQAKPCTSDSEQAGAEQVPEADSKAEWQDSLAGGRLKRKPGGNALDDRCVRELTDAIRANSTQFEAGGRILRLKQYLKSNAGPHVIDAVLDALMVNTRVHALYIQHFEKGMLDAQLERLIAVLKLKRIWALNVGENFEIGMDAWKAFAAALRETVVSYLYVSEHNLIRTNLKHRMRDAIRENRRKLPPQDPDVIKRIGNMWFNPKLPGHDALDHASGCALPGNLQSSRQPQAEGKPSTAFGSRRGQPDPAPAVGQQKEGTTETAAASRSRARTAGVIVPQRTRAPEGSPPKLRSGPVVRRQGRKLQAAAAAASAHAALRSEHTASKQTPRSYPRSTSAPQPTPRSTPRTAKRKLRAQGAAAAAAASPPSAEPQSARPSRTVVPPKRFDEDEALTPPSKRRRLLSAASSGHDGESESDHEDMPPSGAATGRHRRQLPSSSPHSVSPPAEEDEAPPRNRRGRSATAATPAFPPRLRPRPAAAAAAAPSSAPARRRASATPAMARRRAASALAVQGGGVSTRRHAGRGRRHSQPPKRFEDYEVMPEEDAAPDPEPAPRGRTSSLRPSDDAAAEARGLDKVDVGRRGVTLGDLVQAGLLAPGRETLAVGKTLTAAVTIQPDGLLKYQGEVYSSVSSFAVAVIRQARPSRHTCDGWTVVAYRGQRLSELRDAYLAQH